jgi:hypothetical protein
MDCPVAPNLTVVLSAKNRIPAVLFPLMLIRGFAFVESSHSSQEDSRTLDGVAVEAKVIDAWLSFAPLPA